MGHHEHEREAEEKQEVRVDKWLWAVRVFKSRSQATDACRKGHVHINDQEAKPGRSVHRGDIVTVRKDHILYTFRVTGIIEKRVSARLATENMEDLTPPEELEKKKVIHTGHFVFRPKGLGRPTKKERRLLDRLRGEHD